jgi:hypothetical protein
MSDHTAGWYERTTEPGATCQASFNEEGATTVLVGKRGSLLRGLLVGHAFGDVALLRRAGQLLVGGGFFASGAGCGCHVFFALLDEAGFGSTGQFLLCGLGLAFGGGGKGLAGQQSTSGEDGGEDRFFHGRSFWLEVNVVG